MPTPLRPLLMAMAVLLGSLTMLSMSAAPAAADIVLNHDLASTIQRAPEPLLEPGGVGHVVFTFTNNGPASVSAGIFGLTGFVGLGTPDGIVSPPLTWTCEAPPGFTCANQYRPLEAGTLPDEQASGFLPAGGSVRLHARFDIPADATLGVVALSRVLYPPNFRDRDPSNDLADPFFQAFEPQADIGVTVDNSRETFVPGEPTTYLVEVTNHGPNAVVGVEVSGGPETADTTWTCVAGPGAACAASGTGDLADAADLPAGGHVSYAVTLTPPDPTEFQYGASASSPVIHGQVPIPLPDGTTRVVDIAFTTFDPDPRNNGASDYDFTPAGAGQADVGITIDNGQDFVGATETVTYTVVVGNEGPAAANGAFGVLLLPMEPGSITWSCAAAGGATCTPSGVGTPNNPNDPAFGEGVGDTPTLPPGSSATYTVTGTIDGRRGAFTTINARFHPQDPGAPLAGNRRDEFVIDTDPIVPVADVGVTITDGVDGVAPGASSTYSIVVTNDGPDTARDVSIVQELPVSLTDATWSCTPTGAAVCSPAGSGAVVQHGVTIGPGASLTFTLTGTVSPTVTEMTLTTSVSVDTPTPLLPTFSGVLDPEPANDTASDTDDILRPDLGVAVGMPAAVLPGATVPIEVTVTNGGGAPAASAALHVPTPAGTTFVSAEQASGPVAALSTPAPNGTGTVDATWPSLATGASATFVVRVALGPDVPAGSTVEAQADVSTATPEAPMLANTATASTLVVLPVSATISPSRVRVEEGQSATMMVRFSPATAVPTTIEWTAVDGTDELKFRALGSQTPVADYAAGPRTLEVPAGTTMASISVPTNVDGFHEADESFRIRLTGSTTLGLTIDSPSTSTVTIRANRTPSGSPAPWPVPILRR